MFYFATESGDHVIKILICDWSVINVVVVFVCWSCKFCLDFRLLKLFNLSSLFNMSWTDSEIESLITFYWSMLVSGARNFATGVKNRHQKPTPVFWRRFLERVSLALVSILPSFPQFCDRCLHDRKAIWPMKSLFQLYKKVLLFTTAFKRHLKTHLFSIYYNT